MKALKWLKRLVGLTGAILLGAAFFDMAFGNDPGTAPHTTAKTTPGISKQHYARQVDSHRPSQTKPVLDSRL